MRVGVRASWTCLALVVALGVGAQVSRAGSGRESTPVCDELAEVFYRVALYKARGDSKESQAAWVRDMFQKKPSSANLLDRAVEYVYASDASAEEIRAAVLDGCVINSSGQAIVRLPGL